MRPSSSKITLRISRILVRRLATARWLDPYFAEYSASCRLKSRYCDRSLVMTVLPKLSATVASGISTAERKIFVDAIKLGLRRRRLCARLNQRGVEFGELLLVHQSAAGSDDVILHLEVHHARAALVD